MVKENIIIKGTWGIITQKDKFLEVARELLGQSQGHTQKFLIMLLTLPIVHANNVNFEQDKKTAQTGNATFKNKADFKGFKVENYSNQPFKSTTLESYFKKSNTEIKVAGVNTMVTDKTLKLCNSIMKIVNL